MGLCIAKYDAEKQHKNNLNDICKNQSNDFHNTVKILLLGAGESGKSTIFKQMKILHVTNGFTDKEILKKKQEIRSNIHEAITTLINSCYELKIRFENQLCDKYAEFFTNLSQDCIDFNDAYKAKVKFVWFDSGTQKCFKRSNEFQLLDNAKYFLDKIDMVLDPDYTPSTQDILFSREETRNIQKLDFTVENSYGFQKYTIFDVGGQRNERQKWLQVFNGIQVVLFIIASSEFDLTLRENPTANRFTESMKLFQNTWHNRYLVLTGFIVFLNKQDVLEKKIRSGISIEKYFPEYRDFNFVPKCSKIKNLHKIDFEFEKTKLFITNKLKEIADMDYHSCSEKYKKVKKRSFYCHYTIATNTVNIKTVFQASQRIILEKFVTAHEVF